MKRRITVIAILLSLLCWSCNRVDTSDSGADLKVSLEKSVQNIKLALDDISLSQAYQLIVLSDDYEKSDEGYRDSITLDLIGGIYEYMPDTLHYCRHQNNYRLFERTGDSDSLIVMLPSKFVWHPVHLRTYQKCDTVLKNNFIMLASEYHYYFTLWDKFDYGFNASFLLDSVGIGSLAITSEGDIHNGAGSLSEYTFPEGYAISAFYQAGDTVIREFALRDESDTLLSESLLFIRSDDRCSEREYTLSIGNVDIKRTTGIDSIQVFLDDVLQQHAAEFVDENDGDGSICHHRDILLTFDDGTSVLLSELIGPALDQLRELTDSLINMTFAKRIADYIAFNIYYSQQWYRKE